MAQGLAIPTISKSGVVYVGPTPLIQPETYLQQKKQNDQLPWNRLLNYT